MASVTDRGVEILTSPAPHEPDISSIHEYSHILMLTLPTEYKGTLGNIVSNHITGAGRIDLVSCAISFTTNDAKQSVKAGFRSNGSRATIDQVATKRSGLCFTTNAHNYGPKVIHELVPEDTMSRQLQPVSSFLPTIDFMFTRSQEVVATLELKVKVHGFVYVYGALNSA